MRFILCDSKASLTNGVYRYKLDTRLHNASMLQLKKCSFRLTTDGVAPLVVYVRSNAIQKISSEKHTVELKVNNYQDGTDILAILEESHTTGRYHLKRIPRPIKLGYSHLRDIDIYFTNSAGTNVLSGSGGGNAGGPSDLLTAAQVLALGNLQSFYNFSDTTKITIPAANFITGFEAVNDAVQAFTSTGGGQIGFSDFGTNGGFCIDFGISEWVRFTKSVPWIEPASGQISVLFHSQTVQDTYCIFDMGKYSVYGNQGVISMGPNVAAGNTTMVIENNKDYLLTMCRDGTKADADYGGMNWRLEELAGGTVQNYKGVHHGLTSVGQYEYGGHASYGTAGFQISNFIATTSLCSAVDKAKIELYLRDYHSEQTVIRTSENFLPMTDNMNSPSEQSKWFHICNCFDSGAAGNNYGANENLNRNYYTISGSPMSIEFSVFQTETNYDFLTVLSINADGTYDTANPLVNLFTGGPNPPNSGQTITGSVGSIGIRFLWTSDSSNHQIGWAACAWDSSLTKHAGPYVTVPIPIGEQLNPIGSEAVVALDPAGEFVIELDIDTK